MKAHVVERLVPVTIAENTCYLNFSIRAAKEVSALFGGLDGAQDAMDSKDEQKAFDAAISLYAILICEGAKYCKITGLEDVPSYTEDEISTLLNMNDFTNMQAQLTKAIELGVGREVEVQEPKNAGTAQKQ